MKKRIILITVIGLFLLMIPLMAGAEIVDSGTCGDNALWELDDNGELHIFGEGKISTGWPSLPAVQIKRIVIDRGITGLKSNAFRNYSGTYSSLEEVIIPSSIIYIPDCAFYGCTNLKHVSLPNTLACIDKEAFAYCESLTEIIIPKSANLYGPIFECCPNLKTVTLNPQEYSDNFFPSLFLDCPALESIIIPPDNTCCCSIDGIVFSKDLTSILFYPEGKPNSFYAIPEGVTYIGLGAFSDCKNLNGIVFPNSLQSIGQNAFYDCSNLEVREFPDSLVSIYCYAFYNCNKITSLSFPNSFKRVQWNAFDGCPIESLTFSSELEYIGSNAFGSGIYISNINVPECSTYVLQWFKDNGFEDALVIGSHINIVTDKAVAPTGTTTGLTEGSHCSVCGKVIAPQTEIPKLKHGLVQDTDGVFRLYKDGALDTQTYGIVDFNGGRFFVANGEIVQANGLISDGQKWYYCSNGQVADYTGLALYDDSWFYVTNGILDTTRAGIVTYDGGRFMVGAGRIVREVNGLIQDPVEGKWYYVAAGQVADYTGLVQYDGAWFYTINGELALHFSGDVEYNGSWFHVESGAVVF